MSLMVGKATDPPPFHWFAAEATPNTCVANAASFGCGTPPTASSAEKKSSPEPKMQRSPASVDWRPWTVGCAHHCAISFESDSSSTTVVAVCEDSIMIRYQPASESLMLYSSMFGK